MTPKLNTVRSIRYVLTLALRLIALVLIVAAAAEIGRITIGIFGLQFIRGYGETPPRWSIPSILRELLGNAGLHVIGATALIVLLPRLTKWLAPMPVAACPECGYRLAPPDPERCPECGIALRAE